MEGVIIIGHAPRCGWFNNLTDGKCYWQVSACRKRVNKLMDLNRQIEEIFCDALEVAPEERQAYLDHACAENVKLRAEVDKMLSKLSAADKFFKDGLAAIDISEIAA